MQNPFVKWGLVAAVFTILLNLSTYLISEDLLLGGKLEWINLVVLAFCAWKAATETRGLEGGYIRFGQVFKTVLLCLLVYYLLAASFNYLLFNVIDSGLAEARFDKIIEMQEEVNGGELDDTQYDMMKAMMGSPGVMWVMEFLGGGLCMGTLFGLVIGAIVQRPDPQNDLL